jgi:hypothetical protein
VSRLATAAIASAALLGTASAEAAISLGPVTTTRKTPDGGTTMTRASTADYFISYQDCIDNIEIDFAVTSTVPVQVWATTTGADCALGLSRQSSGGCVQLGGTFQAGKIPIMAADLADFVTGSGCDDKSGSSSPLQVTLYFTVNTNGDLTMDNYVTWKNTQVDLVGPSLPDGLNVGAGDKLIIVNIPENNDADTKGYYIYCGASGAVAGSTTSSSSSAASSASSAASSSSSAGGTGGTGGTGGASSSAATTSSSSAATTSSSGAGGAGGGSASTTTCGTGEGIPGLDLEHPPISGVFVCATVTAPATQPVLTQLGDMSELVNGIPYAVGVAAYDEVFNVGPISTLQCTTPQPTTTFFNEYCKDGGLGCGGCGSCAVGSDGELTWHVLACGALAAAGFVARRRRQARRGPGHSGLPCRGPFTEKE